MARAFSALARGISHDSDHTSFTPSALKQTMATFAPQFAGYGQHDSQEFLRFLLEGLHEDVNTITNPPPYVSYNPNSPNNPNHEHPY